MTSEVEMRASSATERGEEHPGQYWVSIRDGLRALDPECWARVMATARQSLREAATWPDMVLLDAVNPVGVTEEKAMATSRQWLVARAVEWVKNEL